MSQPKTCIGRSRRSDAGCANWRSNLGEGERGRVRAPRVVTPSAQVALDTQRCRTPASSTCRGSTGETTLAGCRRRDRVRYRSCYTIDTSHSGRPAASDTGSRSNPRKPRGPRIAPRKSGASGITASGPAPAAAQDLTRLALRLLPGEGTCDARRCTDGSGASRPRADNGHIERVVF